MRVCAGNNKPDHATTSLSLELSVLLSSRMVGSRQENRRESGLPVAAPSYTLLIPLNVYSDGMA